MLRQTADDLVLFSSINDTGGRSRQKRDDTPESTYEQVLDIGFEKKMQR